MKKSERHKIYKKALKRVLQNPEWPYICSSIYRVMDKYIQYNEIPYEFPEFGSFKPKVIRTGCSVWWTNNKKGFKKRVDVLNKCIELTKPKSNGTPRRKTMVKRPSLRKVSKGNRRVAGVGRTPKKRTKSSKN